MAISGVHYRLLKEHAPLFKRGGSLLEIGEANWYGDMDKEALFKDFDFRKLKPWGQIRDFIQYGDGFQIAKAVYQILFEPSVTHAVDLNGTEAAFKQDLNGPLKLPQKYDVVINHGTAEHVFNIAMVFKSMHDACEVGGYMVHDAPCTGWFDHGFYTLQPTLFYDVAAANEYELISLSLTEIHSGEIKRIESREHLHALDQFRVNWMLYVVLRKVNDKNFAVPLQGVYDGRLSEAGQKAWREKR